MVDSNDSLFLETVIVQATFAHTVSFQQQTTTL